MTAETEVRKEVYEVLKVEIEDQCGSDMGSHQDLPKVGADCNGIKHDVNGNGEDDPNHSCVFVGPDLNGDCADKSGSNSGSESKENKDIVGELNFRDGEKVDNCFVQGKDVTPPDSDVAPDTLPFKPEGQGANVVAKTVTEEEQNGTAAVDFEPNPLDGEVKIEEEAQTGTAAVDIEPRPLGGVVKVEEEAQNGAVAVDFEPCLLDGEVKVEEEAQNATAGLDFEPHPLDGEVKVEGEAKNGTLAMDFEPRPLDGGVKVGEEMQNGEVKVEKKRQNGTATVDFEPHPLEGEVKVEEEERNGAAAVDVEPSPLDGAVRVEEEEQNGPAAIDFEPHQMKSEVNVEEEEQNGTAAIDFEPHQQDGEVKVEKEEHIGTAAVDFESHPLDGAVKVGDEEQNGAVAVDSDQLDGEVKVEEKVQPEVVSDGEKGEGVLEAHQDDVDRVKLDKLDNLESTPELDVVLKFGYSSDLRLNTEDNKPTTELEGIEESQTVVSETAGCKCTPTSIGNNLESTTYHSRNAEEIACQVTELGVGKVMLEEQTQFESVRQVQESLKSQITSTKAEPNTYQLASTSTETAPSTSTELAPDAIQLETEVAPNAYQLETEEKKCEEKIRTEEAECQVTELGVGKVMLEEQTQFDSVREVQESWKSQITSTKAEPNAYQLATTSVETAPSTSTELAPDAIQLEMEVAPNAYQLETEEKKCEEKIRADSDLPTNIANVENDVGISQTEVLSDDNRQTGVTSNKIDVNQQTSIDGNEQNEVSEQLSESVDGNEQTEVSELLSESIDGSQQTEVLIKSIDGHQRTFSSGNAEGSPIGCDNQTSVDQDGASTCVADDMKSETEVENLSIKSGENVIFVDDAKSEIFEKGLNGANDVNTEIDVDLGSIKPVDKVPAIPRNKVDTENVIELDTSSRAMVGADATEVINVEDTDTQLRGESGKKENCEEIRDSRDGISASVPGSYSADDGRSTVLDYRKRPFHFLIRIPRYDDENLREQIRLAQLQLDEKTKIRDAIRSEIQMKKDYYIDYEEAKSKERAARELVKSKRQEIDSVQYVINKVKNAISVEDIDSRIHNMEHMIQHETLPLKEEKQFIREIKQLKHLREQLSSNMGSQEELQQAIEQREEIEKRLRVLKKELDSLREKVSKAEVTSGAAEKKFKDENKRLKELKAQFRVADGIRQEAYAHLQSLKKQLYEKNHHFRMYRDNVMSACDYASTGNREALHHLCVDQVERFMELWNEDDVFRKEYIRCNTRSTLRRLNTLDGRALGPDEEPPVLPNLVDERADRPHFYPVKDNSMSLISTSEQAKLGSVMEGEDVDNKAMMKMAEQKKQTTKPKKPAKSNLGSGPVTAAGQERKVNEREQTKEEQELARKAEELKKQEAASKLREQHRLEEEAAVKLKEQRRLEEKAKAKEALERKKRNAEKAQLRAELRAQREAEQKEKEKEKRARKKDRKKVVATEAADCNNEGESAPTSDSQSENNRSPEIKETQISVAKKSQKPSQFSKQIKAKSIPPPLRKKGKRWMQQWMWVILAALFVLALFLLGNSGFSFNLGLQSMRF